MHRPHVLPPPEQSPACALCLLTSTRSPSAELGSHKPALHLHAHVQSAPTMVPIQDYAHHNRRFMLERMVDSLNEVTGATPNMDKAVNIHHNYCECTACKYKVSPAAL